MKMIDFQNSTSVNIDVNIFKNILDFLTPLDVEVFIVHDTKIKIINFETRAKNCATDVLSFPLENTPNSSMLGSIVISIDHAIKVAKNLGHSYDDELKLLFIHGLLHLLGFDHESDSGKMRNQEVKIIDYFNLPKGLIIRST